MTRVVGSQHRTEFILDPAEALRRGRQLDGMLSAVAPSRPRGLVRATHRALNELDDQRGIEAARRVNIR